MILQIYVFEGNFKLCVCFLERIHQCQGKSSRLTKIKEKILIKISTSTKTALLDHPISKNKILIVLKNMIQVCVRSIMKITLL